MLAIIIVLTGFISSPAEIQHDQAHATDTTYNTHSVAREDRADTLGLVEINRIFIIGNRLTRDYIILRELSFKIGDVMDSHDLDIFLEQDKKKLYNTRLFNTVEIRKLELDEKRIDLLIDVNERWYTFPTPIFELSDRNFNEWWQNYDHDIRRVNYGLRLFQYNVRGRNETLLATMQFGFQRVFSLRYRIPYIDHQQRHGLIIDAGFQETKNLAYQTVDHKLGFYRSKNLLRESRYAGITYTYRKSFYDFHAVSLEYRTTDISDTIPILNQQYFGGEKTNQKLVTLSYQFLADRRDVIAYPLKGNHFMFSAVQTGFGLDVKKTEMMSSYAHFFDLKRNFFLSNYTYGYWSTPENQPYNQFGKLGFQKQILRGYELYVIEGPYYFLNKTTFKKRIFSRVYRWDDWPIEQFRHIPFAIYIKTYADFGYVKNYPNYEINARLSDRLLASWGSGIDMVTMYDIVFRFEYTFNHEGKGGFFFNLKKEF